ncbi:hypothetical protein BD626DRAFT_633699 [Schizophyllum amplum]|uniref:F-box domain-containing protein n=1 Tax=Schizophyllum amplum TaxID=97359 RepID=A0A550C2B3_9AGAR|nr:hypothetical protein BD626DRAFT_633699 [Auriculariopsis ampla]
MHYALFIPEIRHTICAEVVSHDALSKLSRVSHDWHDSANVILWQSLDSLIPLLRLMPADMWKMKDSPHSGRKFKFSRPLKPLDWKPVYEIAALVKEIRLHNDRARMYEKPVESESVLRAICDCPPPSTLLPRLRHLQLNEWGTRHKSSSRCILQLVSSSLKSLDVTGPWPRLFNFTSLAHVCPSLESIRCISLDSPLSTGLAGALVGWRALTNVVIDVSGETLGLIFSCLAQLPNLAGLKIYCTDCPQAIPSPPRGSFPSIQRIALDSLQHAVVDAVICSWDRRHIQTLDFSPYPETSAAELLYTINCLVQHCEPVALDEIVIACDGDSPADERLMSFDVLSLLSHFCNLTKVTVFGPAGSGIDDDTCAQLAPLWPKVRRLRLGLDYHLPAPSSCTLSALPHFAKYCRQLEWLTLPLNATIIPNPVSPVGLLDIRNTSLTRLHIGQAGIKDPTAVALFLSAIFPSLEDVDCIGEFENEEDGAIGERDRVHRWAEVRKMLGVLRKKEEYIWDFVEAMIPGSRDIRSSLGLSATSVHPAARHATPL